MKKLGKIWITLLMALLFLSVSEPLKVEAKWVKNSSGTYTWYQNGKYYPSTWFSNKKSGFATVNGTTWCYKLNGAKYKGFLTSGSTRYYVNKNGKLLKSTWIVSGKKKYRASGNGKLHLNGISKVGSYYYAFNSSGVMLTGKQTIKGRTCYFDRKTGRMLKKKTVQIDKKYYYFGTGGTMVTNTWVGKYYYGSDGARIVNGWAGEKYCGSDGKYVTGLQQINGTYYYFASDGKKVVSTQKKINGVTYVFDASGKGTVKTAGNSAPASVPVESTYSTDPAVSDETLLSAIIYCEAGNQPYYGKVAVGIVITNRMKSPLFAASKLKEVVYAAGQFTPARDGSLTRVLNNQSLINAECKKAASEVLAKYKTGDCSIKMDDKKVDLSGYLFFMTVKAYTRLGIKSPVQKIGDHVFFQTWKR